MTEWILSSNPKNFRTDDAFHERETLEWYQNRQIINMQIGDHVYIYISAPVKELHWKCLVTAVKRMNSTIDDTKYYNYDVSDAVFEGPFIELKVIYEFSFPELVSYQNLQKHGLKSMLAGPCRVNAELSEYLAEIEQFQYSIDRQESYLQSIEIYDLRKLAQKHSTKSIVKQSLTKTYSRNAYVSQYAKIKANGHCQLCGNIAPFCDKKGQPYLETHHIVWLSNGGMDSIENTVALCPNCHRKMHIVNDASDIEKLKKGIN